MNSKELMTVVCDYGSFLAEGDLNTRKRELAGFLANISHETGGGNVQGEADESVTGLYFNEEVGFIGSSAIGYVQSTGTSYLPVEGKSYHGRGPDPAVLQLQLWSLLRCTLRRQLHFVK